MEWKDQGKHGGEGGVAAGPVAETQTTVHLTRTPVAQQAGVPALS